MTDEQWHEIRATGIGGSEIAVILGLDPYKTPHQLWLEKTGQIPPMEDNDILKAGRMLEPAIREWTYDNLNVLHQHHQRIYKVKDKPFCSSPDGTGFVNDIATVFELKNTTKYLKGEPLEKWICQANWNAFVLMNCEEWIWEIDQICISWLERGQQLNTVIQDVNWDLIELMRETALEWWNRHIINGEEPTTESMAAAMNAGKTLEASDYLAERLRELAEAKEMIKHYEAIEEEIKAEIKPVIAGYDAITYHGQKLATAKQQAGRVTFDSKRFKETNPELYAQFTKQGEPITVIKTTI